MNLLIKQRVFSWTDTYDVYDEQGNPRYFVKAEFFTLGHQIHVYDVNNREVGVIHQRILTILPKFDIEIGGRTRGTIRREFTFLRPRYNIDYRGWSCGGDLMGWDYRICAGDKVVARIEKEIFHWGDTYVIHIEDPGDEIDVMMLCIAIDAANCGNNDFD